MAKEISSAAVFSVFPRVLREERGSSSEGKERDELADDSQCVAGGEQWCCTVSK